MATLSKLELEDSSQILFVLSTYHQNAVSVQVSDGEDAWEGGVSAAELEAQAKRSKMTLDCYIADTLKALSRRNLGELSFLYSAKHLDNNELELIWKRHVLADNIKFQLGQMKLRPSSRAPLACSLLNFAIDSIGDLQQSVARLKTKSARLAGERETALQDLEQLASIQEQVEKDLFSKFKVVLNEKKGKIRYLMECKEHLTEQNEELRQKLWASHGSTNLSTAPQDKIMSEEEGQQDKPLTPAMVPATSSTAAASTAASSSTRSGGATSLLGDVLCRAPSPPPSSGGATSLLGDVLCRAPSPPPSKRRRTTRPHKSLADLSRPLAMDVAHSARITANISQGNNRGVADKELDSDELLDML